MRLIILGSYRAKLSICLLIYFNLHDILSFYNIMKEFEDFNFDEIMDEIYYHFVEDEEFYRVESLLKKELEI